MTFSISGRPSASTDDLQHQLTTFSISGRPSASADDLQHQWTTFSISGRPSASAPSVRTVAGSQSLPQHLVAVLAWSPGPDIREDLGRGSWSSLEPRDKDQPRNRVVGLDLIHRLVITQETHRQNKRQQPGQDTVFPLNKQRVQLEEEKWKNRVLLENICRF
ncbi:uncharacterized protein V6R79_025242 [Siganus canaliculatus]